MTLPSHRYFTTPIFYASGKPHAGHVYAVALLDILRRHYRCRGCSVRGLTGMDEHGEKIEEKAAAAKATPQAFVDALAADWQAVWASFGFEYDIFLRTSSAVHVETVRTMLERCHAAGDIYSATHTGRYCVDCEAFLTPKEMDENGACLIHKRATETRSEENYYFRTTKYRDELLRRVRAGEIVSQPRYQAELTQLLEDLEGDLSISRPKTRTSWGVELPFDPKHIAYVWFDALSNYVTGADGNLAPGADRVDAAKDSPYWKSAVHVIGKDILRFHGIYWPAMLLSAGLPLPRLRVTGFLLQQGHKMSKSLGNVFTVDEIRKLGRDAFVNMILRACNPGEDMDISQSLGIERYNSDLANGVGNLAARTLTMVEKYEGGALPDAVFGTKAAEPFASVADPAHRAKIEELARQIVETGRGSPDDVADAFDEFRLADAVAGIWKLVSLCDRLIAESKPWDLAKQGKAEALREVLALCVAALRQVGLLAYPFFPEKMRELLAALGEDTGNEATFHARALEFTPHFQGRKLASIPRLFERMEMPKANGSEAPAASAPASAKPATGNGKAAASATHPIPPGSAPATAGGQIGIEDFSRVDVRIGTVLNAEIVDGSDKLLRLKVSLGELGLREILSGIRTWVKPEELVNRKVLVVANLAPRKMKFGTSSGMLLATEGEDGAVKPVFVSDQLKEGGRLT